MIYRGLFGDWFHDIEAESEADAQNKLREALIAKLDTAKEPFIVWPIAQSTAGKGANDGK